MPTEGTAEEWTLYYARFGLQPITRTRRGWHRSTVPVFSDGSHA
jgi:hypothetical protein